MSQSIYQHLQEMAGEETLSKQTLGKMRHYAKDILHTLDTAHAFMQKATPVSTDGKTVRVSIPQEVWDDFQKARRSLNRPI